MYIPGTLIGSDMGFHIVLSFHETDAHYARVLMRKLEAFMPNFKISFPSTDNATRLRLIDNTDLFIPLLSNSYIQSSELMDEFQTALHRHRYQSSIVLFPIIVGKLPKYPAYPQICICLFSILDSFWESQDTCLECSASVVCSLLLRKYSKHSASFKTFLSMLELKEWMTQEEYVKEKLNYDVAPLIFRANAGSAHTVSLIPNPLGISSVQDSTVGRKQPTESIDATYDLQEKFENFVIESKTLQGQNKQSFESDSNIFSEMASYPISNSSSFPNPESGYVSLAESSLEGLFVAGETNQQALNDGKKLKGDQEKKLMKETVFDFA